MVTVTSDVAGLANGEAENASQRKGLFMQILRSLRETQVHNARRMIVMYAHLLPEGVKPADVLPFIAADQVYSGDTKG